MSAAQTSVVVVEIDTRKGPVKTVFSSSIENQSEQAKVNILIKSYIAGRFQQSKWNALA